MLYIDFFHHLLEKETKYLIVTIRHTSQDWKSHQLINYENNIAGKIIKYIGTGFIKFSKWKFVSITSSMTSKY